MFVIWMFKQKPMHI